MKNNKKGFTLVELLAVIVILAIILVIAVPQIIKTIDNARLGAFRSTAKLLISQAEKDYLVKETLGSTTAGYTQSKITYTGKDASNTADTCGNLTKLGNDYTNCTVEVENGTAKIVTLTGAGKFAGYACTNAVIGDLDAATNPTCKKVS